MRILIGLHHLVLGGDTINAFELGCRLRERGHDVAFLAIADPTATVDTAPLLAMAVEHGLDVHRLDEPSGLLGRVQLVAKVAALVRSTGFDVVHAFGHRDTYYAFCASHGILGVPLVINDYAMTVTRGLPRRPPLVVGTREMYDEAVAVRTGPVHVVEPPVDEWKNRPGVVDSSTFRRLHELGDSTILVVAVGRLVHALKGEGLRAAIDAIRILDHPDVRLVLVGDGEARLDLQARAHKVNAELGRPAILLPGPMLDPRPAYAAADIVLGMGHSALRGMAFSKPVIALGERGFSRIVSEDTYHYFRYHGLYGLGDRGDAARGIADQLRPLLGDAGLRGELGAYSRRTIEQRYSLSAAACRMEDIYLDALGPRSWVGWLDDAGYVAVRYGGAKIQRLIHHFRRRPTAGSSPSTAAR